MSPSTRVIELEQYSLTVSSGSGAPPVPRLRCLASVRSVLALHVRGHAVAPSTLTR